MPLISSRRASCTVPVLLWLLATTLTCLTTLTMGFIAPLSSNHQRNNFLDSAFPRENSPWRSSLLFLAVDLPDIATMKATEMKKELESYGVSTKAMLEKIDFMDALKKARADGMKPKEAGDATVNGEGARSTTRKQSEESTTKPTDSSTRDDRYQKAMQEAKTMKVGDLKKELKDRGISTASFFEKSEFIKAYAEAIADNIPKGASSSSSSSSSNSRTKSKAKAKKPEEPMDPSYRDVVTQKFDKRVLAGLSVIDVNAR
mmetsp:Transcript_11223/g.30792  ORF Transcript_11223/g.30792 Transcript_11223/m.30792 type:complete len:259 (-) Transcript_11223:9-785(-)